MTGNASDAPIYFHEALARALRAQGTDTLFGLIGDGNLFWVNDFVADPRNRYVSVIHEAAAVLAANAFSRVTGRLGVATVTHGPALTNVVTALVESVKERTPVLVITGDTAAVEREHLQNVSQREIVMSSGAGFEQARAPHTIYEDLRTASRRAVLERRPIVLNIPVEFQWTEIAYAEVGPALVDRQQLRPDPAALQEAVRVISSSSRPIVLAGQGCFAPESKEALVRLAAHLGAPLATTLRAKGLFAGEPNDLGIFGGLSHEIAGEIIAESDCVIAFGAGLNRWTTFYGELLDGKAVVQIDEDRAAIHRLEAADAGILGDAGAVADALTATLSEAGVGSTGFMSEELASRLATGPHNVFESSVPDGAMDYRAALDLIDRTFARDRTVVVDAGRWSVEAFRRVQVPHPSAYLHSVNFGSIGLGMGNAIGAAVAASDRPVLLLAGDGGFMLGGLVEFNTAVRHGLDIVVVVLNDGAYGAEYVQFANKGLDPALSLFEWPELGSVAESLGGRGYTARTLDELEKVLSEVAVGRDRPVLIDVKLAPETIVVPPH